MPEARSRKLAAALGTIGIGLSCAGHPVPMPRHDDSPKVDRVAPQAPSPPAPSCGDATGQGSTLSFRWPLKGRVTSPFGTRRGRPHRGIDISARYGAAVVAAAPGRVVSSADKPRYGRVVTLEHAGGYRTVYAHNQDVFVLPGDRVRAGQVIADVGTSGNSSGPHLHFELRAGNRPVDPLPCLP